jgi:hypothetical protein
VGSAKIPTSPKTGEKWGTLEVKIPTQAKIGLGWGTVKSALLKMKMHADREE